jgi:hypothetical protein
MNRTKKNESQVTRLEDAITQLEMAKSLLLGAGEPMMSVRVSSLLSRTRQTLDRVRAGVLIRAA